MKKKIHKKAFTLIEVIVATALFAILITAFLVFYLSFLKISNASEKKLIASDEALRVLDSIKRDISLALTNETISVTSTGSGSSVTSCINIEKLPLTENTSERSFVTYYLDTSLTTGGVFREVSTQSNDCTSRTGWKKISSTRVAQMSINISNMGNIFLISLSVHTQNSQGTAQVVFRSKALVHNINSARIYYE
ncbi:MAG: prepilin-type N-terminal cleavage/methylation domain-containing protein [Alphaproteobacteria bacterium]|nr:prepilin-type N-terminal cleavage/methylation domain-containing protein [Alphaproteobacteria bacterium]